MEPMARLDCERKDALQHLATLGWQTPSPEALKKLAYWLHDLNTAAPSAGSVHAELRLPTEEQASHRFFGKQKLLRAAISFPSPKSDRKPTRLVLDGSELFVLCATTKLCHTCGRVYKKTRPDRGGRHRARKAQCEGHPFRQVKRLQLAYGTLPDAPLPGAWEEKELQDGTPVYCSSDDGYALYEVGPVCPPGHRPPRGCKQGAATRQASGGRKRKPPADAPTGPSRATKKSGNWPAALHAPPPPPPPPASTTHRSRHAPPPAPSSDLPQLLHPDGPTHASALIGPAAAPNWAAAAATPPASSDTTAAAPESPNPNDWDYLLQILLPADTTTTPARPPSYKHDELPGPPPSDTPPAPHPPQQPTPLHHPGQPHPCTDLMSTPSPPLPPQPQLTTATSAAAGPAPLLTNHVQDHHPPAPAQGFQNAPQPGRSTSPNATTPPNSPPTSPPWPPAHPTPGLPASNGFPSTHPEPAHISPREALAPPTGTPPFAPPYPTIPSIRTTIIPSAAPSTGLPPLTPDALHPFSPISTGNTLLELHPTVSDTPSFDELLQPPSPPTPQSHASDLDPFQLAHLPNIYDAVNSQSPNIYDSANSQSPASSSSSTLPLMADVHAFC